LKYVDEFRNKELAEGLMAKIRYLCDREIRIMEVCGTHTTTIFKYGIKGLMPETLQLLSGPGCPVCVTPNRDIDTAIALAQKDEAILITFGDMMRVPGSNSSFAKVKAEGGDVRVVYSILDGLEVARKNPKKQVVFFAVGFETTSPTIAVSVLKAREQGMTNFFVLSSHKLIPPAMKSLLDSGEVKIDGFLCPGHVSTIIGSHPYQFIARKYEKPAVITGFEPLDILQAIWMILDQIHRNEPKVAIQYSRVVAEGGNPTALRILEQVFEETDVSWRGMGMIPRSGLKLREAFQDFDAKRVFSVEVKEEREHPQCICGEILKGVKIPTDCKLFRKVCNPDHPIGACMVSIEGTCLTYFQYYQ
jgi:hydrogenase expression/formation protein HypD